MDAFVDGMNGGEEDDVFATMDALRGSRRRKKSTQSAKGFHHPLYHPPLPTPPPGIKLGGAVSRVAGDSDADDDSEGNASILRPPKPRPGSSRQGSTSTITPRSSKNTKQPQQLPSPPASVSPPTRTSQNNSSQYSSSPADGTTDRNASIDEIVRRFVSVNDSPPKPVVPSISDIIRTHAPEHAHKQPKQHLWDTSYSSLSSPMVEEKDSLSQEEPSDVMSRSSIDSIAEEVQRSLQIARKHPATALHHARSFPHPSSVDRNHPSSKSQGSTGMRSRRSEGGYRSPSISSFSTSAHTAPPSPYPPVGIGLSDAKSESNHALATFLRSPRLTRLLKLKRFPNQRLQVSFSDLGSSTGKPIVIFLGLGCVRYIMGLYDEMAEALGLRLITIDRWGLGRTDNPSRNAPRGVKEWASVVDEVLDYLNVDRCGIMAHSAGAPYAMAFANRSPERIQGDLCLLAPWVGAGEGASGYKWLKYVPTGLIKTAQAAEWKVQAWMLGKPPAITYSGIGYNVHGPVSYAADSSVGRPSLSSSLKTRQSKETARPSCGSFSDYDDLADFRGKYASRSTIHVNDDYSNAHEPLSVSTSAEAQRKRASSKSNRFFGALWKTGEPSNSRPSTGSTPGKAASPKLKSLKSMSSLRGSTSMKTSPKAKRLQTSPRASTTGTIDEDHWYRHTSSPPSADFSTPPEGARGYGRSRRSISLSASVTSHYSHAPSFAPKGHQLSPSSAFDAPSSASNAALGNALLAASHAESSRGTHADLLQILNHSQKPWGFSYGDFPHAVKVWYGDKDEKIAEGAVKWLEKTMRPGSCQVCIIKGAGHGLMYNGGVVVEALEFLKENWTSK
ncbi:alpha/beta-hydrolase [Ramaria rubella]|nr:alpha/beta-hydrolase [Ramaria rubella]